MKKIWLSILYLILFSFALCLSGCGKEQNESSVRYEIVDGRVVEITGDVTVTPAPTSTVRYETAGGFQTEGREYSSDDFSFQLNDGSATSFPDEAYNSLSSADKLRLEKLRGELESAADACREIYSAADKGGTYNVTLSSRAVGAMLDALGNAGFSAIDSNGRFSMRCYEPVADFGERVVFGANQSMTYFVVYIDGHLSLFNLCREAKVWHLISMSMAWNDDLSPRIYSEGRYAIGKVEYTAKGWLIYNRNTSDFDDNQKANTDSYTMLKVLPPDETCRRMCEKYVEPVGYLENNLFITDWDESDFSQIDFNSLYAYVFQLANGTPEMLSSYNVRNYYKSVQGTKLYLVPLEFFEANTRRYFNIDNSYLRRLADFSSARGGYYFLGYDRSIFNVTPRTPKPEVTSVSTNADGTVTLKVDAVNPWYGTDRAFTHILTVRPMPDGSFKYVSNYLLRDDKNILPEQKLSLMRQVEIDRLSQQ